MTDKLLSLAERRDGDFSEAHSAVAVGIAERFLCQPREMAWEQRCDELATAAIEAMQLHILFGRNASINSSSEVSNGK